MAKSAKRPSNLEQGTAWDAIADKLERAPGGMHQLEEPTVEVPLHWPSALVELYLVFGGGELFLGEMTIAEPSAVQSDELGWQFATVGSDAIWITKAGTILRGAAPEHAPADPVLDGTRLDRWLHGNVDALGLLFDARGEYVDWGDRSPELAMARAQLKRDAKAPGPRWRLARALVDTADYEKACDEYEAVVAALPTNVALWLEIASLSELGGNLETAYEEALTAATVAPSHPACALAWATVARFASIAGNAENQRAAAARFALTPNAEATTAAIAAAGQDALADGDLVTAKYQLELAAAVAPAHADVAALSVAIAADSTAN